MFKKVLSSFLIFALTFTAGFNTKSVSANDDTDIKKEITFEEDGENFAIYRQTKTVIAENVANQTLQKLAFCNKNKENLEEVINNTLLEKFKLKETKEKIDLASNNASNTIKSLNDKKQKESEVRKVLYSDIRTDLNEEFLLAVIIFCEAGNQSYEGKVAVGNVVLNRVASPRFKQNTIESVIRASGQFEPVWTGWYDREISKGVVNESCMQAAKDALNGVNIVGDCLFFHRTKGYDDGIILGDHVFY